MRRARGGFNPAIVTTRPDLLLRLEAMLVLAGSVTLYGAFLHANWWLFAALFLAPDLSLLGYASTQKALAAGLYNAVHSFVLPLVLGIVAWRTSSRLAAELTLIWIAHIAFDRLLGFGLKYREGFKPTHIQSAAVYRPM